jgi:acetyl-CoA decarbonylase/synthase complex subunit epsilon
MNPGQTAEISGPKKAFLINKPTVAVSMIKRAKRPLLIIGSQAPKIKTMEGDLIDTANRITKATGMTIAATGHIIGQFKDRNIPNTYSIPLMSLGDRLKTEDWNGLDGQGPYDLILIVGHPYYMAWLVLSGLKNFNQNLTTLSIGASYQPNASWSTGSMPTKRWMEQMAELVTALEEK